MEHPNWAEEFGIPRRFPRTAEEQIKEILWDRTEPKIFLKLGRHSDSIIIKFHRRSTEFLARRAESLPAAFEEALWRKVKGEDFSGLWSELEAAGRKAYREAWAMLYKRMHHNRSDPRVEKWLRQGRSDSPLGSMPKARLGRPRLPKAQERWLKKQFDEIFPQCELVHKESKNAAGSFHRPDLRRKAIWEAVRKAVHRIPEYGAIFSGEAFDKIKKPKGRIRVKPRLEDPEAWTPRQLAIALIAIQLGYHYQTMEKLLARLRPARRK